MKGNFYYNKSNNGTLNLPPDLPVGTYFVKYNMKNDCLSSNNAMITINITNSNSLEGHGKIKANYCFNDSAYTTIETVLEHFTIGGVSADDSLVDVVLEPSISSIGYTLNSNGTINVPSGSLPGTYAVGYTVCPTGSTIGCIQFTSYIHIESTIQASGHSFLWGATGNFQFCIDGPSFYNNQNYLNGQYMSNCTDGVPLIFSGTGQNAILTVPPHFTTPGAQFAFAPNGTVYTSILGALNSGNFLYTFTICDYNYPNICVVSGGSVTVTSAARSSSTSFNNENTAKTELENKKIFDASNFTISPNPSDGTFFLNFNNEVRDVIKISVYNMIGQLIYEDETTNTDMYDLNLNIYSVGTYLLKTETNENTIISKIIIK